MYLLAPPAGGGGRAPGEDEPQSPGPDLRPVEVDFWMGGLDYCTTELVNELRSIWVLLLK